VFVIFSNYSLPDLRGKLFASSEFTILNLSLTGQKPELLRPAEEFLVSLHRAPIRCHDAPVLRAVAGRRQKPADGSVSGTCSPSPAYLWVRPVRRRRPQPLMVYSQLIYTILDDPAVSLCLVCTRSYQSGYGKLSTRRGHSPTQPGVCAHGRHSSLCISSSVVLRSGAIRDASLTTLRSTLSTL
jgi:hypothetical protein